MVVVDRQWVDGCNHLLLIKYNIVAVSDTYWDDISDGYSIRDRIYSGQHHILGKHTSKNILG